MAPVFEQLPLAVQLRDDTTFDNFYPGDNLQLLAQLRQQLQGDERYLYIFGAAGCGRSHLLQAACHHAHTLQRTSVYLPLRELQSFDPEALFDGLEQLDLVCLDDIHCVAGNARWEQALFHLFNRLQQSASALLVSADRAVRELPLTLADLSSRLSWGVVVQLSPLDDAGLLAAVRLRAANRGLQLSEELARFVCQRCRRDMGTLVRVVDTLDQASLRQQRRLTLPFIKSVLGW